jgi:hypothetical protein
MPIIRKIPRFFSRHVSLDKSRNQETTTNRSAITRRMLIKEATILALGAAGSIFARASTDTQAVPFSGGAARHKLKLPSDVCDCHLRDLRGWIKLFGA